MNMFAYSNIFHELGLHKPDVDETWYDHNYVTRRITAYYSRHNVMFENTVLIYKKVVSDKNRL